MARKSDDHRLRNAAKLINEWPGQKSGVYARMMGCHREIFNRLLVQLDDWGFLLFEDRKGGLWPFRNDDDDG
jgi:hypothetical protein